MVFIRPKPREKLEAVERLTEEATLKTYNEFNDDGRVCANKRHTVIQGMGAQKQTRKNLIR